MGRLSPGVGDGKLSVTQFLLSRRDPGQCCAGGAEHSASGNQAWGARGEHFALLKC